MDTLTDNELITELATRHSELIVIRPKASNVAGSEGRIVVFCKTKTSDHAYDLFEAVELLHEAGIGLIRDCLVVDG